MSRYKKTMLEALEEVRNESKQKPYISSSNGTWIVLDADGKEAYKSTNYTLAQAYFKKNYDKLKEEADHEISMARGELEAIADKATQLASMLKGKSDEGNPLEAWVQSKITKAKDYINSVSDYLMYNPDMKQNEELEEGFSSTLKQKAKELAKKFANNMTKAVDEIEKLAKGLSNDKEVYATLRQYNEEIELDEGRMKDIFTMGQEGKSADEIAKILKLPIKTVKRILGEQLEEEKDVPKGYHKMPDGSIMKDSEHKKEETKKDTSKEPNKDKELENKKNETERLKDQVALLKQKLENEKNKAVKPEPNPQTGEVPLSLGLAQKLLKDKEVKKEQVKEETLDEFTSSMIKDLQKSYADLKDKTLSPEKATALSKHLDRIDLVSLKQLVKANIPFVSTLAKNKIYKKTGKFEERRLYVESLSALKDKADKTGMPYNILKQVYDRGMAAWKSGHRPGAGQHQWALARVNSFVTKSSGTWGGADKDLAAKVKGSK